jgi:hypothetical protein
MAILLSIPAFAHQHIMVKQKSLEVLAVGAEGNDFREIWSAIVYHVFHN